MPTEVLLLLIGLAAFCGWLFARLQYQSSQNLRSLPPEAYRGFNYVLNDQPDKAIEVFSSLINLDVETVETHLALGSLYRRRGEIDKATKIHQNILSRSELSSQLKNIALFEIGQDFLCAGLLGRAETALSKLVELDSQHLEAMRLLLSIYEQEKDWNKAINLVSQIERVSGDSLAELTSQYYCELAEVSLTSPKTARHYLSLAIKVNPECLRALFIEIKIALSVSKIRSAYKLLLKIKKKNPDLYKKALHIWFDSYLVSGNSLNNHQSIESEDQQENVKLTAESSFSNLGEKGLFLSIGDLIGDSNGSSLIKNVREKVLVSTLGELKEKKTNSVYAKGAYVCGQCGFDAKKMHWQCPSCNHWETLKIVDLPTQLATS